MLALKILAGCVAVLLAVGALHLFEERVSNRYGSRFLTRSAAAVWISAGVLLVGGHYWWRTAVETGGDQLNGIVLMSLGGAAAVSSLAHSKDECLDWRAR